MKLTSETFKTVTGMHKAYKSLRYQLCDTLGIDHKARVRFQPGCFTFMILGTSGTWLPFSSDKITVEDYIRLAKDDTFKIETVDTGLLK